MGGRRRSAGATLDRSVKRSLDVFLKNKLGVQIQIAAVHCWGLIRVQVGYSNDLRVECLQILRWILT